MSGRMVALFLVLAGFLLGGVVSFAIFLITGIIYSIGATNQIIVVLAAVITGGMIFSALGLSFARYWRVARFVVIIIPLVSAIYVLSHILVSPVLTLPEIGIYSFFNMSSNAPVSLFVSGVSMKARGKYLSAGHFLTLGTGSPVSFAGLFITYAYFSYSNLPMISLAALVSVFIISGALIFTVLRLSIKGGKHGRNADA